MTTVQRPVDARHSTFTNVEGNVVNNIIQCEEPPQIPSRVIDAPIDNISVHFTGRKDELEHIKDILDVNYDDVPTRCVVYGSQGLGKSQLMLKFAKLYYDKKRYSYAIWISATTLEKLTHGYANLLDLIGHPDRLNPNQAAKLTTARRWLEDCTFADWLLMFDNVVPETLSFFRDHLPRQNHRGNILFTTITKGVAESLCLAAGRRHGVIELSFPDVQGAAKLLSNYFEQGELDVSKAEELVSCLSCLPLAIAHAAGVMKESGESLDDMLNLCRSRRKFEILSIEIDLPGYAQRSIVATFTPQMDDLEAREPNVSNFLKMLSFLDPENIPLDDIVIRGARTLVRCMRESAVASQKPVEDPVQVPPVPKKKDFWRKLGKSSGQPTELDKSPASPVSPVVKIPVVPVPSPKLRQLLLLITDHVKLLNAIQQLKSRSLVWHQPKANASVLGIHDLIQLIVRERVIKEKTEREWFEAAVKIVCLAFHRVKDPTSSEHWGRCEMFIPHIQLLNTRGYEISKDIFEMFMTTNLAIAGYLYQRARYNEAEKLYDRVRRMYEKCHGATDRQTLGVAYKLSTVYGAQGRYSEAEELFSQVLEAQEKQFGPNDSDALSTVHRLAVIYRRQGRYKESEELYKRVLSNDVKKGLPSNHPDTLATMENLANIYGSQHRFDEAENLYGKVLELLDADSPRRFSVNHNLAHLLTSRVISDESRNRPGDHPQNRVSETRDRFPEAERLLKQAWEYKKAQVGEDHPDTLSVKHDLAELYQTQKKYDEAIALFEQVLESQKKQLGIEHPETLGTERCIIRIYNSQGDHERAEVELERVLKSMEKTYGPEHKATLQAMFELGKTYRYLEKYDKAEKTFDRLLECDKRAHGPEHPDTAKTMHQLARVYKGQGHFEKGRELFMQAEKINKANGL